MHIDVDPRVGKAFFRNSPKGPVVMLNMLRFRDLANYSAFPSLAPPQPISGAKAYALYSAHVLPLLTEAGSEVIFRGAVHGTGGAPLIGPVDERWDLVLVVRHQSVESFMKFATDKRYLAVKGHRSAALADSRLIPLSEMAPKSETAFR